MKEQKALLEEINNGIHLIAEKMDALMNATNNDMTVLEGKDDVKKLVDPMIDFPEVEIGQRTKRSKCITPKSYITVGEKLNGDKGFVRTDDVARRMRIKVGELKIACERQGIKLFYDADKDFFIQRGSSLPDKCDETFWASIADEYEKRPSQRIR